MDISTPYLVLKAYNEPLLDDNALSIKNKRRSCDLHPFLYNQLYYMKKICTGLSPPAWPLSLPSENVDTSLFFFVE